MFWAAWNACGGPPEKTNSRRFSRRLRARPPTDPPTVSPSGESFAVRHSKANSGMGQYDGEGGLRGWRRRKEAETQRERLTFDPLAAAGSRCEKPMSTTHASRRLEPEKTSAGILKNSCSRGGAVEQTVVMCVDV